MTAVGAIRFLALQVIVVSLIEGCCKIPDSIAEVVKSLLKPINRLFMVNPETGFLDQILASKPKLL